MIYTDVAIIVVVVVLVSSLLLRSRLSTRRRGEIDPALAKRPTPAIPGDDVSQFEVDASTLILPEPELKKGAGRARETFSKVLAKISRSQRPSNELWDELEETLLLSDLGLSLTSRVIDGAKSVMIQGGVDSGLMMIESVRRELMSLFLSSDRTLKYNSNSPTVWLIVGVNGVGKTTSIGKLAFRAKRENKKVVLAAGDTFRAAAADQLEMWAERTESELVRSVPGADPSSVVFDGIQKAAARGYDLVIADTAGRLHTKSNLMEELKKLRRIAEKEPGHLEEVLLVLDATTGQNGLVQAREFANAAAVTGVILTKLDGSSKGGIALAVEAELNVPIKLVGVGERVQDLIEFSPSEFVDALLEVEQIKDSDGFEGV